MFFEIFGLVSFFFWGDHNNATYIGMKTVRGAPTRNWRYKMVHTSNCTHGEV